MWTGRQEAPDGRRREEDTYENALPDQNEAAQVESDSEVVPEAADEMDVGGPDTMPAQE